MYILFILLRFGVRVDCPIDRVCLMVEVLHALTVIVNSVYLLFAPSLSSSQFRQCMVVTVENL